MKIQPPAMAATAFVPRGSHSWARQTGPSMQGTEAHITGAAQSHPSLAPLGFGLTLGWPGCRIRQGPRAVSPRPCPGSLLRHAHSPPTALQPAAGAGVGGSSVLSRACCPRDTQLRCDVPVPGRQSHLSANSQQLSPSAREKHLLPALSAKGGACCHAGGPSLAGLAGLWSVPSLLHRLLLPCSGVGKEGMVGNTGCSLRGRDPQKQQHLLQSPARLEPSKESAISQLCASAAFAPTLPGQKQKHSLWQLHRHPRAAGRDGVTPHRAAVFSPLLLSCSADEPPLLNSTSLSRLRRGQG